MTGQVVAHSGPNAGSLYGTPGDVHVALAAAGVGTHPPEHAPDAHDMPHAPQLSGSLERSAHAPLQQTPSTSPLNAQATPLAPEGHVGGAQAAPSSVNIVPLAQATELPWHLPQVSPVGQLTPHAPQLLGSVSKPAAHTPAQQVPTPPSLDSRQATPEFPAAQVGAATH